MAEHVTLLDVSARDGLQDEACIVATGEKLAVAQALIDAGVAEIEITSFVHPAWVPQLADADVLAPRLPRGPRYSALIMNVKGYDRARAAFADHTPGTWSLAFVASASPRHNMSNNNRTIEQTLEIFDAVAARARSDGVEVHGAIACSFVSPYADEPTDPETVASIARRYERGGCTLITLADTVGRADPYTVALRIDEIAAATRTTLSLHLHDSFGYALANVYAGLTRGIRRFEGALAGLGGCPFAPDAPGNLDLERLNRFVTDCGFETGIDSAAISRAGDRIRAALRTAKPIPGRKITESTNA
ncbi:hydroxymethylglutaryl-CoA lyase [bacterium]|nr:MAG: hydroxymethylglutaryl-CoA lyase [bacterium]